MATLRTYTATVDSLDPLARWRFNETEDEGNSAIDRIGGLNGTYNGSPQLVGGFIGDGAAQFDGGDFVEVISSSGGSGTIRLAFLGDSFVAGFGVDAEDAFPDDLEEALEAQGFDIDVLSFGEQGKFSAEALDEMPDVLAAQPDAAILVLGANDSLNGVDPGVTESNLRQIIQQFQAEGVEVLLTGTFGLWPNETFNRPGYDTTDPENAEALASQFEAIFPALATELGVPLFDPFLGGERVGNTIQGGVLGNPALNQGDGVHPNAAGVDDIVTRILPQATDLVESAGSGGGDETDPLALAEGAIEMWFAPEEVDGTQALFSKDAAGTGAGQVRAVLDDGRIEVTLESASASATVRSAADAVLDGQTTHLAFVFGAAGIFLYLNGELVDQNATVTSGLTGNTEPLLIGRAQTGGAADLEGVVDEVLIYDQPLTAQEVAALYEAGLHGGTLTGTSSADELIGSAENDNLRGAGGNDVLRGLAGDDILVGNGGRDELLGGAGDDLMRGGGGRDVMYGHNGADRLFGGGGKDIMHGNAGDDVMFGRAGPDRIYGNLGADELHGDGGSDRLRGGADDDSLFGGAGKDALFGNAGNDLLDGGPGDDLLVGGPGADTYQLGAIGHGIDTVRGFETGPGGDALDISAVLQGFVPGSSDPAAFVQLSEVASATEVAVNANGSGNDAVTVFSLADLTGLTVQQLVDDGNLVLA